MSLAQTRCSASPMAATNVAGVRAASDRSASFVFENIFSIGIRSGLHGAAAPGLVHGYPSSMVTLWPLKVLS